MTSSGGLPAVTAALSGELRSRWPGVHLGIYGDAAHQARPSDHNLVTTSGKKGPRAIDFMSVNQPVRDDLRRLILTPAFRVEHRISLFIDRGVIYSLRHAWRPRPYTGADPHISHAHISCDA